MNKAIYDADLLAATMNLSEFSIAHGLLYKYGQPIDRLIDKCDSVAVTAGFTEPEKFVFTFLDGSLISIFPTENGVRVLAQDQEYDD